MQSLRFLCPSQTPPRRRPAALPRGFTAIELMVVVSIVAILAALAAPSFTPLIERWRVRQAVEGLQSSLYYARSEAIKRGGNVVVEKLPNNTSCTTASGTNDWGCGWQVLACSSINSSGNCVDPEVLQHFDTPSKLAVTRTSGGKNIKLNRWGLVDGTWIGISIVPQDKSISDAAARGVCVSSGGRIRVISDPPCTSG
ncbi:MAG TPA: GspH/FimT family pseudopilin [Alicycliphilus denitrificans]|nr:GspH/FimT family pseudopilin [Alicycliphilus denitrificans]